MIALHAIIQNGQFLLWGETDLVEKRSVGKSRTGTPAHPFAATQRDLAEALEGRGKASSGKSKAAEAVISLPTTSERPVVSNPLIGEPPTEGETVTLAPWRVAVLPVEWPKVVELLLACGEQPLLKPGLLAGGTLHYWAAGLRFAAGLVAREQFLPGVSKSGDHLRAVWFPQIIGAERGRFRELAAAMPAACRAVGAPGKGETSRSAADALNDFLNLAVDHLVRSGQPKTLKPAKFDSVHAQWLAALRSDDGEMKLAEAEFADLARSLDEWRRPLTVLAGSGYRLCFRLEEPKDTAPDSLWTVRYLLQAEDDPSLLIPMADLWKPRSLSVIGRVKLPSREFLLTSLGQAAKLCREVDDSLKSAAPGEFTGDSVMANRFLSETAGQLEQAGFGVLLPGWWTRSGVKQLSLTASAKSSKKFSAGGGGMSLDEMVKFDWKIALGDTELTLAELDALARLKSPLVNIRGRWVQVNADEIRNALDFWKKHPKTDVTLRDALKMSLGAADGPNGLPVSRVKAGGKLGEFLDQLRGEGTLTELPPPAGFVGSLRPYQLRGYSWLTFLRRCGLGACLADDMGLGKSIQTLAAIQAARDDGETRPVLLVCPTSVVGHWRREAGRFTPSLTVMIHHGLKRTKGEAFAKSVKSFAIVVTSYQLLLRDEAAFNSAEWAGVILDEAQNIKNPDAKTSKAARALKAGFRVALTGTPVENHVGDLWSVSQFLNPGFLGGREAFRKEFLLPIQLRRDEAAANRLKRLTGPFLLRRLKTDKSIIADLPDKFEAKVYCTITKEQASLYEAVVRDLEKSLKGQGEDGIKRKGMILGTLSKLKQVCNHPAQFLGDNSAIPDRSGKLARLTEMLEEVLDSGDQALVFTQFTQMGDILKKHLQETFGREVMFLHGGVPQPQREQMVSRFQNTADPDSPRIFLISLKAGGTGLTLTAANHVFHFDRWWNPAVENQATDRAFRIGQTRSVQVHKFVCVGTMEEKIDQMIEQKKDIAGRVVGTGEGWLTEMSNTELKELLALRPDAVEE
ncbi:DEAD/DEAH box helicase [Zavarzinella formosa]|uniref:DEAD/DEAH box helicase n=1 Tax=Zavarzinella formosa TaxID=360055 RepID=UPI00030B1C62|nr:DEAD/DEAH box helicase [Zavarzinella formosa]